MILYRHSFVLLLVLALCFTCCTSMEEIPSTSPIVQSSRPQDKSDVNFSEVAINERKVIYSAALTLTVKDPDSAVVQLTALAQQYNGYVNQSNRERVIIRVKSEFLEPAMEQVAAMGKVEARNVSGMDVTEEFLDFQIRLDNAKKARERYLELLAKAENVGSALLVEKELERLNGTIDRLTGKINRLNHLEAFSTLTVTLKEKTKPGLLGYIGIGLYHSVKWLFVRN
ncbi:MAG: DUF4349 domain-containing protein [Bacteroidota bacterium]